MKIKITAKVSYEVEILKREEISISEKFCDLPIGLALDYTSLKVEVSK